MYDDHEKEKKAVKTGIVHYHIDKQSRLDIKWYVLAEEIHKILTAKHNTYKGL